MQTTEQEIQALASLCNKYGLSADELAAGIAAGLSPQETRVCKRMHVQPADYAANKATPDPLGDAIAAAHVAEGMAHGNRLLGRD
jgi:hypothetical protein